MISMCPPLISSSPEMTAPSSALSSHRDTPSILEYDGMERELEYLYNFSLALVNGGKPEFRKDEEGRSRRLLEPDVISFYDCDVRPTFFRSSDPAEFLKRWVYVYLRYPQSAVDEGVQGRVLVDFVIDEKGQVQERRFSRDLDVSVDNYSRRLPLPDSLRGTEPAEILLEDGILKISFFVAGKEAAADAAGASARSGTLDPAGERGQA